MAALIVVTAVYFALMMGVAYGLHTAESKDPNDENF